MLENRELETERAGNVSGNKAVDSAGKHAGENVRDNARKEAGKDVSTASTEEISFFTCHRISLKVVIIFKLIDWRVIPLHLKSRTMLFHILPSSQQGSQLKSEQVPKVLTQPVHEPKTQVALRSQ